jgi:hypothetical protein
LSGKVSRRFSLAWVAAATASPWLSAVAAEPADPETEAGLWKEISPVVVSAVGYGKDPDLKVPTVPWPLSLDQDQRANLRLIADLMLPADDHSPSAGTLSLDAFLDEWVSAPYPQQQRDRILILSGLAWLDAESLNRFRLNFGQLQDTNRRAILDAIAFRAKIAPGYERPARFFGRLRELMMAGFYTRPQGMVDLGFLGNTPHLGPYPGPPQEAIDNLNTSLVELGLRPVS